MQLQKKHDCKDYNPDTNSCGRLDNTLASRVSLWLRNGGVGRLPQRADTVRCGGFSRNCPINARGFFK